MLRRIALVIWILGALSMAAGVLGAPLALLSEEHPGGNAMASLGVGLFCGITLWTISFVLSGSFLRPPKQLQ